MVQPAVRTIKVTLSDNAIEPHLIEVPADYPIRFSISNVGSTRHEFAIPHEDYSVDLLPGQSTDVTWTFVDVGRFEVVSRDDDDREHGLRGEIEVQTLMG
jgi:uncharacterized cupredoxin-like copper-binding protein